MIYIDTAAIQRRRRAARLTDHERQLFDAGLSVLAARRIARGACPFCLRDAHARACAPLRVLLIDPPEGPVVGTGEGDDEPPDRPRSK